MSMMMKLINAAAGQNVGDLTYFFTHSANNYARLSSVDMNSGEIKHGTNFASTGVYFDAAETNGLGYTIGYPQGVTSVALGDDGFVYLVGQTDLTSTHSNTGTNKTDILMRFNSRTLAPEPGFFYNMLTQSGLPNGNSSAIANDFCFHPPSGSIVVAGGSIPTVTTHDVMASQTIKIDPWPSTAIDASASGYYHSSSNPNGRIYGAITTETGNSTAVKTYIQNIGGMSIGSNSARVETNGTDKIAFGNYGANESESKLVFKKSTPYKPTYSYTTTTNATLPSPDPFTEMRGQNYPHGVTSNVTSWKATYTSGTIGGIRDMYYRPGNTSNNTPGQFIIVAGDGYFHILPEDGHKPVQYGKGYAGGGGSINRTMLSGEHSGILITRYLGSPNFSNTYDRNNTAFPDFTSTHSGAGVQILDIDRRNPNHYVSKHTGAADYYNNLGSQAQAALSADAVCELLPLANNPNNKHLETFVQTKSGRIFGITENESTTQISPHGGFRMHELYIGQPDANNFDRRSISWGDSIIVPGSLNSGTGIYYQTGGITGNISLNDKTFNDSRALGKTRWLDQGHSYMQDVPADTIYLRENTTIYAINPNTRSNITSNDFANQGAHALNTGHSLINPNANLTAQTGVSGGGSVDKRKFFPSITFSEGANTSIVTNSSPISHDVGYDRVGDTTFDMIYGDDSRVYLALKATVYNGSYHTLASCHTLIRFHTGTDGTELVAGVTGPHPHKINDMKLADSAGANPNYTYPQHREMYWYGLFSGHTNVDSGGWGGNNYAGYTAVNNAGDTGFWSEVNLVYDNKRDNVICVGRRDFNSGDSYNFQQVTNTATPNAIFSRVVAVPANSMSSLRVGNMHSGSAWPGTDYSLPSSTGANSTPRCAQDENYGAIYGGSGNWESAVNEANNVYLIPWCSSFNSSRPNGQEKHGILAGEVRNVTLNGKSTSVNQDIADPTLPNRGSQVYFSGMTIDGNTHPYDNSNGGYRQNHGGYPHGQNRIGALPSWGTGLGSSFGYNVAQYDSPGYGDSNTNHHTSIPPSAKADRLYHAQVKLKTSQTVTVSSDNNEEGIRCVWYYKGAFHGVTTYNEGTYVYMPEPEHTTANDNTNTVTHYVSQCESGQNSYNNVIGGSNTKIGTAEGCKNSDWAACVAPGGILCLPKQDSGYAKAGFIGINLGTKTILNTSSGSGQPFEAPSSVNPNNKQIKQMVVTSTGKIWAILDYENASASTLQFRILQVVFNSNYSSVTWSGGLYTSQASNSNSGHVKFYRTVCGNMPQSKMEWDAV